MSRKIALRTLCLFSLLLMTACGIKPGSVDAPPGAEDRPFPRTYPAPDPAPVPPPAPLP